VVGMFDSLGRDVKGCADYLDWVLTIVPWRGQWTSRMRL